MAPSSVGAKVTSFEIVAHASKRAKGGKRYKKYGPFRTMSIGIATADLALGPAIIAQKLSIALKVDSTLSLKIHSYGHVYGYGLYSYGHIWLWPI